MSVEINIGAIRMFVKVGGRDPAGRIHSVRIDNSTFERVE